MHLPTPYYLLGYQRGRARKYYVSRPPRGLGPKVLGCPPSSVGVWSDSAELKLVPIMILAAQPDSAHETLAFEDLVGVILSEGVVLAEGGRENLFNLGAEFVVGLPRIRILSEFAPILELEASVLPAPDHELQLQLGTVVTDPYLSLDDLGDDRCPVGERRSFSSSHCSS